MFGPILPGEKISLEPPRPEYLETYRLWFGNTDVTRYMLFRFVPSPEGELEWYRNAASSQSDVLWAIVAGGRPVGSTGIHRIDWLNRHAWTGTVIGEPDEWGKGYGSEVVRLRTRFAFDELNLHRLETESFAENTRMHRALQKAGYREIGRRRSHFFRAGKWQDELLFELLAEEWRAQ